MSVRETSPSDSLGLQFKLASFHATLENYVQHASFTSEEMSSLRADMSKMQARLEEKDKLLQKLSDAESEVCKQAIARSDVLEKEKTQLQESLANAHLEVKELTAKHLAAERAIAECNVSNLVRPETDVSTGSNKVERAMIDAMAKEQQRLQLRLEKLEAAQEELLEVAKSAQSNHLTLSSKCASVQSEARRAMDLLGKAVSSLCAERKKVKELCAKLQVAQTKCATHKSQIQYLQDELSQAAS